MISAGGKAMDNVIKALRISYNEKENAYTGVFRNFRVMNHIRSNAFFDVKLDFFYFFQHAVWKIAPVTGVLVILLGIALVRVDFLSDYELVRIFINDPADLSFLSLYNG